MRNVIKCDSCGADVLKMTAWQHWIKMVDFIEFLEHQGLITEKLSQEMFDCMMNFKKYAEDEDEAQRKEWDAPIKSKKGRNKKTK